VSPLYFNTLNTNFCLLTYIYIYIYIYLFKILSNSILAHVGILLRVSIQIRLSIMDNT
jgi:hypothetical protein